MRRLLVMLALATASVAAPATPASAAPCPEHSCLDIYICWDCIDGPYLGCWDVSGVVDDLCV